MGSKDNFSFVHLPMCPLALQAPQDGEQPTKLSSTPLPETPDLWPVTQWVFLIFGRCD